MRMIKLSVVAALSFAAIQFTSQRLRRLPGDEAKAIYVAPPKYMPHMAFGYNESMADTLWLRTIQDLSLCQNKEEQESLDIVKKVEVPKGITDKKMQFLYSLIDKANAGRRVCRKGWVFRMLDAVTELAPRFRMPYDAGALSLSVLIDDYEGAGVLFDKAVDRFPDDWQLLYKAAYHYLFDQKDMAKAAELLVKAGDAGAPYWVKSLAATLYTTQGQLALAVTNLEALKRGTKSDKAKKNLDKRIEELKQQAAIIQRSQSQQ